MGSPRADAPGLAAELRFRARVGGAVAWTGALPLLHTLERAVAPAAQHPQLYEQFKRRWARGMLRILGVSLDLAGDLAAAAGRGRLVVANHRSGLDIPILYSLFGGTMLSRGDLSGWPVIGWAARQAGTLFVDRDSPQSGTAAIRGIKRVLKDKGTVILFPEGTTYAGDTVRPLQHGAFAALRGLDVEVVPVGLAHPAGTEYVEDDFLAHAGNITRRPRVRVSVVIGTPWTPSGNARDISAEVQVKLQELVHQARDRTV